MAFKISPIKSRAQGRFLFLFVWGLTLVATLERSLSARDERKERAVHE